MPNWVKNELVLVGSDETIKSMLEVICNPEHGGIDFEKIKPMPEELHNVTSPVRIISEAEYQKEKQDREMRLALGTSGDSMFETYSLTKQLQKEYIEKFGCDNWYDWACANWGTKWNACQSEPPIMGEENGMTTATLNFETAWSCPVPVIEHLSNEYPDVLVRIKFSDEDFGSNVGEGSVKCGVWISENVPESGSKEAYEMADYFWGMLEECYKYNEETGTYEYDEGKEN